MAESQLNDEEDEPEFYYFPHKSYFTDDESSDDEPDYISDAHNISLPHTQPHNTTTRKEEQQHSSRTLFDVQTAQRTPEKRPHLRTHQFQDSGSSSDSSPSPTKRSYNDKFKDKPPKLRKRRKSNTSVSSQIPTIPPSTKRLESNPVRQLFTSQEIHTSSTASPIEVVEPSTHAIYSSHTSDSHDDELSATTVVPKHGIYSTHTSDSTDDDTNVPAIRPKHTIYSTHTSDSDNEGLNEWETLPENDTFDDTNIASPISLGSEECDIDSLPAYRRGGTWPTLPHDFTNGSNKDLCVTIKSVRKSYKVALHFGHENYSLVEPIIIGNAESECPHCGAMYWKMEVTKANKAYRKCCRDGTVTIEQFKIPNDEIDQLYTGETGQAQQFREEIRWYNRAHSFGTPVSTWTTPRGRGPQTVKLNGTLTHRIPISPNDDPSQNTACGQIYFIENVDAAVERRRNITPGSTAHILPTTSRLLENYIRTHNPLAQAYKYIQEAQNEYEARLPPGEEIPEVQLWINPHLKPISARTNVTDEEPRNLTENVNGLSDLAAVFVGEHPNYYHDVIIYPRHKDTNEIRLMQPHMASLDNLTYTLLHLHGEKGIMSAMHNEARATMGDYYRYRIQMRSNTHGILHYSEKLYLQYVIDAWLKIEYDRLHYIETHQKQLRLIAHEGLRRFLADEAAARNLVPGRISILPSHIELTSKWAYEQYYDAMTIIKQYGKPDIFLTFTTNTKWPEIEEVIAQSTPKRKVSQQYRPDVVCRAFSARLRLLMLDIVHGQIFGKVAAFMYVIEFQKRGLPHAHIAIIMKTEDKIETPEQVDRIVSARIPDKDAEPHLYAAVSKQMVHNRCDVQNKKFPCIRDGKCRFGYPKAFAKETTFGPRNQPFYKRPMNARTISDRGEKVDNQWIVPHNRYLLVRHNAHINVEVCGGLNTIKYLMKYMHKNTDKAVIGMSASLNESKDDNQLHYDEIAQYKEFRYISAPEAIMRLQNIPLSLKSVAVTILPVHEPGMRQVMFDENGDLERILEEDKQSKLEAFFKLNAEDENAEPILYTEVVSSHKWNTSTHTWVKKKSPTNSLARMQNIHLNNHSSERFHLAILLRHIRGPKSFQHIRTVNNIVHNTFKDTCEALGLIRSDREYDDYMKEVVHYLLPRQARRAYAQLLVNIQPTQYLRLWIDHQEYLSSDFTDRLNDTPCTLDRQYSASEYAIADLHRILLTLDSSLNQYSLLGQLNNTILCALNIVNNAIETDDHDSIQIADVQTYVSTMNTEQLSAFNQINDTMNPDTFTPIGQSRLFFIDGPAGTGKTYLYTAIFAAARQYNLTVGACASTGIAATLLPFGKTAHKMFGIPIKLTPQSQSSIDMAEATHLLHTDIFLWDEVSSSHRDHLRVADDLLRNITGSNRPFGGKIVVFGGDFRQTLPVIRGAPQADIINCSAFNNKIWPYVIHFKLTKNMRVQPNELDYASYILQVGNGNYDMDRGTRIQRTDYSTIIPDHLLKPDLDKLMDFVFADCFPPTNHEPYGRSILTPTNKWALSINEHILDRFPGDAKVYTGNTEMSADSDQQLNIPIDILETLTPAGCPPHILRLKENCIVMLLRNLDLSQGLCNGTILKVIKIEWKALICIIQNTRYRGNKVTIPRIRSTYKDLDMVCEFRRTQFPVRLAYAMTINKSQGQTLERVGLFLPRPVFGHGQLYVALSRVKSSKNIAVSMYETEDQDPKSGQTKNVVYCEVFETLTKTGRLPV